jgi:methyl-accepting chemotaxis protein
VKITSGLGEALPRSVCIVPLLSEGKILGAIEIASFNRIRPAEMEYLKKISENIGHNLNSIENNRRTEMLLEESQKMAQEVKAQEEELRLNMVELQAAQEQMRRKQSEMDAVLSSLSTVELDLEGNVIEANAIFLGITGYALTDIQGKFYKNLIPQSGNDPIQYEMMWNSILAGRSFSGEFRIVNKSQKEMWMAGNFTPLLSENGQPYKVMVISLFTTEDKEKLIELQEMVTAIKNCFPIAEINQDMTFKSANDLFLSELGIRRLELKKTLLQNIMTNGSYGKLEQFLNDHLDQPNSVILNINNKSGVTKDFNTTLIKIGNNSDQRKKGLMILRNPV